MAERSEVGGIVSLPASSWLFAEPTVPTPHFLFVPPKRKRAVDGTKEKGGRGSRSDMVRPPPNPRAAEGCGPYSVRLTVVW